MLEKQKDIDAVLVATADHMHATIAWQRWISKHVYVQKPLTWCVKRPGGSEAGERNEGRDANGQSRSFDR
jgi:hypothetical protein